MRRKPNTFILLGLAALVVVALAGATTQQGRSSCCGATMALRNGASQTGRPFRAKQLKNKQSAAIVVSNGYSPAVVEVKKGIPVELTFTAGKDVGCGGTVVFQSLNISKDVVAGSPAVIRFTPKRAGDIPFTCGMGMLQGKVVVK